MRMMRPNAPREERGAVAVLIAVLIVALMSVGALTIDFGAASLTRRQAQNAADATARDLAVKCAKGLANCTSITSLEQSLTTNNASGATPTVLPSSPKTVKVQVTKTVNYRLATLFKNGSSGVVHATATASWGNGHVTEAYKVLPLGVSYCTWKNHSGAAGTATEAAQANKIPIRTDTLQSVTNLLAPLTTGLLSLVPLKSMIDMLTGTSTEACQDSSGTQLLAFQGGVWLTGENVLRDTLSGLFNFNATPCELHVANGLNTFLGGLESAAFIPSECKQKFGPGKLVDVGQTILLPIYKPADPKGLPFSGLDKVGLRTKACASLLNGKTCLQAPPQIGVEIVGYAPFKVTGYTYPGTPSPTDTSVTCSSQTLSLDLKTVLLSVVSLVQLIANLGLAVVNGVLHTPLQASISCNGLQGYFAKTFTQLPDTQYGTGGEDFGTESVKLID